MVDESVGSCFLPALGFGFVVSGKSVQREGAVWGAIGDERVLWRYAMLKKYFFLLMVGLISGSQFLITQYAIQGYTPLEVGVMRIVFGLLAVSLFASMFSERKRLGIQWYHYAIIGFLEGTLPCLLVPWVQQFVQTSVASVLFSTMPVFAMIFSPLLIKQVKFHVLDAASIAVGFVGVSILVDPSAGTSWLDQMLPELAILVASASWALSLVFIKRLPEVPAIPLTRNILLAATIEILPIWLLIGHPADLHWSMLPFIFAVLLGTFTSGVVYIFYVLLIRSSGVNFTAFSYYLVPVFGILLGVAFLGEKLMIHEMVGGLVIILALLIQSSRDRFQRQPSVR